MMPWTVSSFLAFAVVATTSMISLPATPDHSATAWPAGTQSSADTAPPGDISATFLDPYDIYGASASRLDAMFEAQQTAGIHTIIYQWSGWMYEDQTVSTTYPAGSGTGFGHFDSSLPAVLAAAQRHDVAVWVGLLLRNELFDSPVTRTDSTLFQRFRTQTNRLAVDVYARYGPQIAGWYIPVEPGDFSVSNPTALQTHANLLAGITDDLDAIDPGLPVMVSPAVPRAIFADLDGIDFVNRLEPMMRDAGVDIWNLQVGFKMTAWPPEDDAALIRRGQEIAARYGAVIWADMYVPGPGRNLGDPPDANFPTDPQAFLREVHALSMTRASITIWTFDDAMNPDPARAHSSDRQQLFSTYQTR